MKRVSMELGGHAPVIVCEDADIALAVRSAGAAKFRNAGQVCIAPTRFLVHESVKSAFATALATYARDLIVGDGLAKGTQMGPLANPRRLAAMTEIHEDAVSRGATVLAGGDGSAAPETSGRRPSWPTCRPSRACSTRSRSAQSRASAASTGRRRRSPRPTAYPTALPLTRSLGRWPMPICW